jgi:hypothetical protein
MIGYVINSQHYTFWILALVIFIFVLWIFIGGEKQEFVGLAPLRPDHPITPYIKSTDGAPSKTISDVPYLGVGEDLWSETEILTDLLTTGEDPVVIDTTPQLSPEVVPYTAPKSAEPKRFESKGERTCREILQGWYRCSFPNCRPSFLRNPETGYPLELDCYNEDLKIAVEYNGIQHYVWPNWTNQSREQFIAQVRRDELKVNLCDLNGVYLITVPYNVPHEKIKDYLWYYLPPELRPPSANPTASEK